MGRSPARAHPVFFELTAPETDLEVEARTMPRWSNSEDPWEDDLGLVYDPEDRDWPEDDDEEPTIPCPNCRREIHEDSQRCPYCESHVSQEDAPPSRKPWWIIIGVVACLYVVYRWNVWW
jgi:hypothetical protein